jgi:hypothetical protein
MGIIHKFNQTTEFAKQIQAIKPETAFEVYKDKIFNY